MKYILYKDVGKYLYGSLKNLFCNIVRLLNLKLYKERFL